MSIDYSQKKYWTVELLEETLKYHTVIKPNEKGNFDLLWQAKLDCEKTMGHVMRPAKYCRITNWLNRGTWKMQELIHICPECGSEYMISKPLNQYLCINGHMFNANDRKEWRRKRVLYEKEGEVWHSE